MIEWQYFHFLRPGLLYLLLVLMVVIGLLLRSGLHRTIASAIAPHLAKHLQTGAAGQRWLNPLNLCFALTALAIVALAGPTWDRQSTPFSRDQSVLVVLLDVSETMLQQDIQPSRLARAKQKIRDLLALRPGTLSSLIVFSRSAHTVLPATDDSDILSYYLQSIEPGLLPGEGSYPERALAQVAALNLPASSPVTVLWVGDGVSAASAVAVQGFIEARGYQLLIWGIGTAVVAVPGDGVLLPLEREALQTIAAASGGHYNEVTVDASDIKKINGKISHFYSAVEDEFSPWIDRGYYLLLPIGLVLLLWFRRGWSLSWVLVVALGLGPLSSLPQSAKAELLAPQTLQHSESLTTATPLQRFLRLWFSPAQLGRWYFERGEYALAAQHFRDPLWRAQAYYRAEDFDTAAHYFAKLDSEYADFFRANSLAQAQRYVRAVALYQRILVQNPGHLGAANNRQLVQGIIDEINLMSAAQRQEQGDYSEDKTSPPGDPQRAQGAERESGEQRERKQFSAEQLLADNSLSDMWMRSVQRNASQFLRAKFSMQRQQRGAVASAAEQNTERTNETD